MSNTIYTNFDIEEIKSKIDISRLKRDYSKEPLKTTKNGIGSEYMPKEDIEYLYIELNLIPEQIAIWAKTNKRKIQRHISKYKIYKPEALRLEAIQRTNIKKYGCPCCLSNPEIRKKIEETFLKIYGVKNPFSSKKVQEKIAKHWKENFNCENPFQVEYVKEKIIEFYRTNFNVDYNSQTSDFVSKMKHTKLERYGDENYVNIDKIQSTCKQKYGVSHYNQTEESKQKHIETCLRKYGTEHYTQTVEYQKKSHETRKRNKTHRFSSVSNKIYKLLQTKFPNVEREYNNILYSYNGKCFDCDFYIPELDLYIEYQGYKGHGLFPYDKNNEEHKRIVELWKQSSEEINFKGEKKVQYLNYINIWTQRDPLKRKIAKENNLNWIEFFTFKEFMEWFNLQ